MKNRKWWLIPVVILAILVILAVVFWQTLMIYIAPKTVLVGALTDTISALESRFSSGPLPVLTKGLDPDGKNTIDLQLNTANDLLGNIRYDMNVQMEQNPRRILAQGKAEFQKTEMDLSVYLDGNFAALSSSSLLQGNFYGLTYETFPQDIRSSTILRLLIREETMLEWENSVAQLETVMNKSVSVPDVSQMDPQSLILGIMALDAEVAKENLVINGQDMVCVEISFETTGKLLLDGLSYLKTELPVQIDPDSEITASFYLYQDSLVKIAMNMDSDISESDITILLGMDASRDDIRILSRNPQGFREIGIRSSYDESIYHETISINQSQNNVPSETSITYSWNRTDGHTQLSVTREGEDTGLSLYLQEAENGFALKTDDFEALLHLLTGMKDKANSPCTMVVSRGAQFETPEYKSFHQWSMEDMLTLLNGIGGLLGLKIA